MADGILSGPIDLDGPRRPAPVAPKRVPATPGLVIVDRRTKATYRVRSLAGAVLQAEDRAGNVRKLRNEPGVFAVDGQPVELVPAGAATPAAPSRTASGSIASDRGAQVARASRILVEGIHDAELLEKVWGDDLRHEGIVVERLDGMDHLDAALREFRPGPGRRIGVLLDHLVDGSKEARAAAAVRTHHVLVTGHPFVDVWAAIKPKALGIERWPDIPVGQPWKEGICSALGVDDARAFWQRVLRSVGDWTDLETPIVTAVERLIDFVSEA
jgi:hypothetical protein